MVFLSVLSFLAATLYLHVGLTAFFSNKKSRVFRIFLLLTLSLTIWTITSGFLYLSKNEVQYSFWNKAGAFGWCTFEALVLYFVLVFTENKYLTKYKYLKYLVLAPAPIFLYMVLFLFGPNINTSHIIENIFYVGNFLYNFIYLAVSIILIILWGKKSKSQIHKNQAVIIAISSIIPFLLNLLFAQILPALGLFKAPNMGQIFTIIMFLGINYAITKYQFMSIPTTQITYELFNELTGLALLMDSLGYIMKANHQLYHLLGYSSEDVIGMHISEIIKNNDIGYIIAEYECITEKIQFENINIITRSEKMIPFNISIVPLRSNSNLLRGILLIGEDIRTTLRLQEEVKKHKLTNNRLTNSETLFRRMVEITPVAIMLISTHTHRVVYLNNQAVELFGANSIELIGTPSSDFFVHSEDLEFIRNELRQKEKVEKSEVLLKRTDSSTFIGLINTIPSIFHEEEVSLSSIVDVTDQKKSEEALKLNNQYIKELNAELITLNKDLMTKSIKDGLTNLYNHQYINEILEHVLQDSEVNHQAFCIMMIDIDHFKRVNDLFGHLVGDSVLSQVSDLIMKNSGDNAFVGRYGGEEFITILPGLKINEAAKIAESVRYGVQAHCFEIDTLKVTISIGLVEHSNETSSLLVNKADMLLYQAKHNGRNRIEMQLQKSPQ